MGANIFNENRITSGVLAIAIVAVIFAGSGSLIPLLLCAVLGGVVYTRLLHSKTGIPVFMHEAAIAGVVVGGLGALVAENLSSFAGGLGWGPPSLEDQMEDMYRGMGMSEDETARAFDSVNADPFIQSLSIFVFLKGAVGGLLGGAIGAVLTRDKHGSLIHTAPESLASLPNRVIPGLLVGVISLVALCTLFLFSLNFTEGLSNRRVGLIDLLIFLAMMMLSVITISGCATAVFRLKEHPQAKQIKLVSGIIAVVAVAMGIYAMAQLG